MAKRNTIKKMEEVVKELRALMTAEMNAHYKMDADEQVSPRGEQIKQNADAYDEAAYDVEMALSFIKRRVK